MNWLLTIVFLLIMFYVYSLIGKVCLEFFNFDGDNNGKKLICGFFCVFFLGFIIGFPCQLMHLSWQKFKIMMFFLLATLIIICIIKDNNYIRLQLTYIKCNFLDSLLNNLKEYWFLYVLVIVFTLLSMTNVLPYYRMNYDDSYYIGKIVNQVGAHALSIENFFNGSLSGGETGIARLLNTYEISYGFFADLFHISIPFFCKVTMVIHNYMLVFIVYKVLGESFVKKEISQFCLIPFSLLLISAGYAMEGNMPISINMFDGWQFQTAIFYGGSLVRTTALPVILIFSEKLIYKMNLKNIIFIGIVYLTYMSFSTIFLIHAIIGTIMLFFSKGLIMIKEKKDKKAIRVGIICTSISSIVVGLSIFLDKLSFIIPNSFFENLNLYIDFADWYFFGDTLVYYALAILVCLYFIFNKSYTQFVSIFTICIFLLVFTRKFNDLLIVSSGFYWFVALRFATSVQLLILFIVGCLVAKLFDASKLKQIIISLLSSVTLLGVVGYIYINLNSIREQNWLASGMTEYGYTLNPILKNDKMIPNIMVEIGDYFNKKEYGNYSLLLPKEINWDGYPLDTNGFVMASNRIELCTNYGAKNLSPEELNELYSFYSNDKSFIEIKSILDNHDIKYILVQDVKQKDDLIKNEWILELYNEKINETFYLLSKRN